MKSWQKSHYVSLFGFINSYFAPIYHFGPDLALFIYVFQYLALLNYIYPHLVIFTLTCPRFDHIMPYSPYFLIRWHFGTLDSVNVPPGPRKHE